MPNKFDNKEFETHIKKLIINKEIYRMLEQLRSIMRKIVLLIGEEDWNKDSFTKFQRKNSLEFLIDYSFVCCVNELITVLNDSGTLAPMAGVKKWQGEYETNFLEYLEKSKEIKSNKNNLNGKDKENFKKSLEKLIKCNNENDIQKSILQIGEKYQIERRDLVSIRGFTFELEDRILGSIWDEE